MQSAKCTWRQPICSLRSSEWQGLARQRRHLVCELVYLDDLVLADIREMLPRVADRPEHLEVHDARRLAEADVLLQRRSAKAAAAVHGPIDRSLPSGAVLDRELDARADAGTIGLDA